MLNSFFEIRNDKTLVFVEGHAVIDYALRINETFNEAFNSLKSIVVNVDKVDCCDITFIQLVSSLCYSLNREGRTLEFDQNMIPLTILETIKAAGYDFRSKCSRIKNVECVFTKELKCLGQKMEQHE